MSSGSSAASAAPAKPFPVAVMVAMVVALTIALMPLPDGLTVSGQRILAILAFAVIVWLTEALDYAVSSVALFLLTRRLIPPEKERIEGGKEAVRGARRTDCHGTDDGRRVSRTDHDCLADRLLGYGKATARHRYHDGNHRRTGPAVSSENRRADVAIGPETGAVGHDCRLRRRASAWALPCSTSRQPHGWRISWCRRCIWTLWAASASLPISPCS